MLKFYNFDIFVGSFRTRFEVQCNSLSKALDAVSRYCADMSEYDCDLLVCSRYVLHTLNDDGVAVSVQYRKLSSDVSFDVVPYSNDIYDSTIFVPFMSFSYLVDSNKV